LREKNGICLGAVGGKNAARICLGKIKGEERSNLNRGDLPQVTTTEKFLGWSTEGKENDQIKKDWEGIKKKDEEVSSGGIDFLSPGNKRPRRSSWGNHLQEKHIP